MKYLAFIVSLVLLWQTAVPFTEWGSSCAVSESATTCCSDPVTKTHEAGQSHPGDHECPPDCHCVCCGFLAILGLILPEVTFSQQVPALVATSGRQYPFDYQFPIWQPPPFTG